ncbi:MAG: enoyl-CoA hydratase/isomerase family protein [Bordetella sp.]|nr:enoyl-CoA hydratase/isomerase family protein [Bordetella sp.]
MTSNSNLPSAPVPGALTEADSSAVRTRVHGAVFRIELNRGDARNPLGAEMVQALEQTFDTAEKTDGVRVILFCAAGKAFSAGGDLGNIADRLAARPDADGRDPIATGNRRYGAFLERLARSPKITVACVQGAAMGGGAGLACAVDISIGAPSSKFGFPEAGIGLVPGQILPFVSARLGAQVARRLMLTGERIDAAEAYRIGLLDYLSDSDEALAQRAMEVITKLLAAAPCAGVLTKQLVEQVRALGAQPSGALAGYLDDASGAFARQMRSEAVEGVTAARERRPAQWNPGVDAALFEFRSHGAGATTLEIK